MTRPTPTAERFVMMQPIYDTIADDPGELADLEAATVRWLWREKVELEGGVPVSEPTLTRESNVAYGWVMHGPDGEPLRDEDGNEIINCIKLFLVAAGWVERSPKTG